MKRLILFVAVCLALSINTLAANQTNNQSDPANQSNHEGIPQNQGRPLDDFLTPDGRFDLEAAREVGYEGPVDISGFNAAFDPATGEPMFKPSGERH
jgi:hypothetical protein